ncbi:MAG: FG-GAP repeat domain-containing protein [Planctomycetaceae bacterium]
MRRALAALLLLAAAARAGHEVAEVEAPPVVDYRVARDLDGDGKTELLLMTPKEAWFWRGRAGHPPARPDEILSLPEGAALFDFAALPETPGEERLLVRTHTGIYALGPGFPARRTELPAGPGLPPAPANLLWRSLGYDLDGDGRRDFIDVSTLGYTLTYAAAPDPVRLPPALRASAECLGRLPSERHVARVALAQWASGRFDGDAFPDLALLAGPGLLLYPGNEAGRADASRVRQIELPEATRGDLAFHDFNGDGWTDALAVDRKAGTAYVILADPLAGLAKGVRIPFAVRGTMRAPVVEDLDGDGRLDLALPYFPNPSVQDAVRWFVRGEVVIYVPIFLNRGGSGCFSRVADRQVEVPIRLRVSSDAGGRISVGGLVVVEYAGDLDGDGRKDLLVTEAPGSLAVHRGVPESVFEQEPSQRLAVPDASSFEGVTTAAADLNGDGRSDIILHYRGAGRRPDRVLLLMSGKE